MDTDAGYLALIVFAVLKFCLAVIFALKVIAWLDDPKRSFSIVAGFVNFFYFLGFNA